MIYITARTLPAAQVYELAMAAAIVAAMVVDIEASPQRLILCIQAPDPGPDLSNL